MAAYGLAARAGWPRGLTDPALEAPVAHLARGLPFPRLFLQVWEERGDLQRLFPLETFRQRFAFLRWLVGGGLAELGVEPAALPAEVRTHPAFRLARLSVRHVPKVWRRPAATGRAETLEVVEHWAPGGGLAYEAASGGFRTASGAPAPPPAQVAKVLFHTGPGLVPADAMALLAQGVAWSAAASA